MFFRNSSNFIVQGGILAFAGIISRIIGLLYRIPLQKGLNKVSLRYKVPGLKAGAILSAVTLVLSLALAIVFRRKK